ncbi:MAG: hypothetical protein LBU70_06500 [Chitinispirillales bacterium]|jgi:hypothetical protein|nr:hypothetical protein [Chitinispirillales bacterium]
MKNENLYHDPIEEVYRIREAIMEEFGWDIKKYHAHLDAKRPHWEAIGFKKAAPRNLKNQSAVSV